MPLNFGPQRNRERGIDLMAVDLEEQGIIYVAERPFWKHIKATFFSFNNIASIASLQIVLTTAVIHLLFCGSAPAAPRFDAVEKNIRRHVVSDMFQTFQADRRCDGQDRYGVYLIDNFEQRVGPPPEA